MIQLLPSTIPISSCVRAYSLYTALIDQPVRPLDFSPQRSQFAQRSLELGFEGLARLPSGRINLKLLAVLLEHRQKAIVIVLVVALQFGLGREVLDLCAQVALQPAQEALDLRLLLPGSSPTSSLPGRPGESCTTSDSSCSAMKLPASSLGRPLPGGPDLGEISLGIELLAGLGGRCYGVGVAAEMRRNIENLQCSKPF